MLENLSYIYQAMYALDFYDKFNPLITFFQVAIPIGLVVLFFGTCFLSDNGDDAVTHIKATRIFYYIGIPLWMIVMLIWLAMPGKNTVKAYIGIKAVQAAGDYLDKNTNIPERSKHTMTRLWDKVDGYIESIDVEEKVEKTLEAVKDSTTSKATNLTEKVKKNVNHEVVDSLVQSVKQQAIDSVLATIKK